jgi:PhzF family phenazine biosynthesis protein
MRVRVIDAFTDKPFAGNPAAVCLLGGDSWPDEGWMRSLAMEMRHSETAFTIALPEGEDADFALRWFTPASEVDLCGHATLATAHALHTDRGTPATVRFRSRSGILLAHSRADGSITLDFPAATLTGTAVPNGLAEALGAKPDATFGTGSLGDLLAVFPDEPAVRGMAPDFVALTEVIDAGGVRGVIVTAPPADPSAGYDFVSRFFAPGQGINEDPVTGSAHTALAPYWTERLGRNGLSGLQASARTGLVATEVRGDRVHLTGRAVTVLDATLHAVP